MALHDSFLFLIFTFNWDVFIEFLYTFSMFLKSEPIINSFINLSFSKYQFLNYSSFKCRKKNPKNYKNYFMSSKLAKNINTIPDEGDLFEDEFYDYHQEMQMATMKLQNGKLNHV